MGEADGWFVAGNGAAAALVRRWVVAVDAPVHVPESIGSSGGYSALHDGMIRVALAARPPTDGERRGLEVRPFARCPMVVAFHETNPTEELSLDELVALWRGDARMWPHGAAVVPILREPGDTGEALVAAAHAPLRDAFATARAEGRWPMARSDEDTAALVLQIPGAIGFVDAALVQAGHATPRVGGRSWEDPAWPWHRDLRVAWRANDTDAARFVAGFLDPASGHSADRFDVVLHEAGCHRITP